MAKKKKAKQRKLTKKIMTCCVVSYLVMVVSISAIVGLWYYLTAMETYRIEAYNYTQIAARYINSDMIRKYEQTKTKDAEYNEIQEKLLRLKEDSGVPTIYVYKILEGRGLYYYWVAYQRDYDVPIGTVDEIPAASLSETVSMVTGDNKKLQVSYSDEYGLLGSTTVPIYDETGNPVAFTSIDISLEQLILEIVRIFVFICIVILVVAAICIYIFYRKSKKEIVEPINKVNDAAKNMLDNIDSELQLKIDCSTGDEVEDLAHSFEKMASEVKQYIRENAEMAADKERIETELNVATRIQASMLPLNFPDNENYTIAASMTPAKEVGGDFYDFFTPDDSHVGIVMADVSGKGVPAALFMVSAKAMIKDAVFKEQDLGKVFEMVNASLSENNTEFLFVTAFLGVLDIRTGSFAYVNAGHEPLYIKKAGGQFEMLKLKPAVALACMPKTKYEQEFIDLKPGDRVFQYTDGITEATNGSGEFYEFERLTESLFRHADKSASELLQGIREDLDSFVRDAEQADDITMLCLDYKKKAEK